MLNQLTEKEVNIQRVKAFAENPELHLVAPCKIGEGILRLTDDQKSNYETRFEQWGGGITYFVPASGSGSRMFQFLYEFLTGPTEENRAQVERFLNSIEEFAFFRKIPQAIQHEIRSGLWSLEDTVAYILSEHGLNFGALPKGLIPFHLAHPFILNPFQEQVLQLSQLKQLNATFHFTVQPEFESAIRKEILHVSGMTGQQYQVSFSTQDPHSNAVAFTGDQEPAFEDGVLITRPSGHGALLTNLNAITDEVVVIKNIDNLQHFNKSAKSTRVLARLSGLLLEVKREMAVVYDQPNLEQLRVLNDKYQLYSESQMALCHDEDAIRSLLNRPVRVCGMVKNIGQPGGGPFWVEEQGVVTKQIVEKAQIGKDKDQSRLMVQSTHFNPVLIVLSPYDVQGHKFDYMQYADPSKYFIVEKDQGGQRIRFIEQPGLWNGSMAHWNTIFVEIPSSVFSPVKTVLDLLDDAHRE
jgi:hypothetical protein